MFQLTSPDAPAAFLSFANKMERLGKTTTSLYDRRRRKVTRNIVEWISI